MRLAHNECGKCYAEKSPWQRPGTLIAVVTLPVVVVVGFFAFIMLAAAPG
jgi:hypothetical protein